LYVYVSTQVVRFGPDYTFRNEYDALVAG